MWNPFAKKENEFKLDEHELPSLSDTKVEDLPQVPTSPPQETSMPSSEASTPIDLSMSSSNTLGGDMSSGMTSTYEEQTAGMVKNNLDNSSIHQDISKAKMETMEAKMSLIEAKISSVDQKLELLNQMVYSEISDETKKKFKIDAMMKKIKE